MNKIEINTPTRTLTVAWANNDLFTQYLQLQRSVVIPPNKNTDRTLNFVQGPDLNRNLYLFYLNYWQMVQQIKIYDNLPENPVILDIGSGMSILDFLAYQYLDRQGKFYLVDHEDFVRPKDVMYSPDYKHYHSWEVCRDIITTSNFDANAFKFIDNTDWPDNIDLITAYGSWCWHFPRSTYWDKVKRHLKVGGRLVIEISQSLIRRGIAEENAQQIVDAISDEFQSVPEIFPMNPDGIRVKWTRNC